MTDRDDFDRTLAGWFEAEALAPATAGDLDRVLDLTRRRSPRPGWLAGSGSHRVGEARAVDSSSFPRLGWRWSTALLLLAIAGLVGGAILVGALSIQPSPLPTGRLGHLAYALDGDIYVADWDGSNPVRIADGLPAPAGGGPVCGDFRGEGPMWSPDGRHLAFRSSWDDSCHGTGDGKVYVGDSEGHVVSSFPGTGWRVAWSPDSTRVATWLELGMTIGVYGLDGTRQALLTLPPGYGPGRDEDPDWSPDGESLLISLNPGGPNGAPRRTWELPIDGRTPQPVPADDPRSHWGAAYSRDGAYMAFKEAGFVYVAAADGTQQRLLAHAGNHRPPEGSILWSPTGDRVAFSWRSDAPGTVDNLRVMEVTSGNSLELVDGIQLAPLRFSPEGDRILYWQTDHDDVPSVLSVSADGSDRQILVTGTDWGDWQWQRADR